MKELIAVVIIAILVFVILFEATRPEMVNVRVISISPSPTDPLHNHMIAERIDTLERRSFHIVLGNTNDLFRMNWNANHE